MRTFRVTLRSLVPITRSGQSSVSIEVIAENIEEAKQRGHLEIARRNGKHFPIFGVTVTAEEL